MTTTSQTIRSFCTDLPNKLHWRATVLRRAHMPLTSRLKYAWFAQGEGGGDPRLLSQLHVDDQGQEYFEIKGRRIYFHPGDGLTSQAEYDGVTQIIQEAFVEGPGFFNRQVRLSPGDTVLDVGGNLGTSAMLFAQHVGENGRIISFEPVFDKVLAKNMHANGIEQVQVVAKAVADTEGTIQFAVTDHGIDSRIDDEGEARECHKNLPVTTLDAFVEEAGIERVDFIKMDIEGAERRALLGAKTLLERDRPKLSIASYHSDGGFVGQPQHPLLVSLLRDWGYNVEEKDQSHIWAW